MKIEITNRKEADVKYIWAEMQVRYWDDGMVNGVYDDDDNPKMPMANGNIWDIIIDVDEGKIKDWPEGVAASVHYKVCDAGRYMLLDESREILLEKDECYVPSFLSPGGNGYGDYVIMNISEDGTIENFNVKTLQEWVDCIVE